MKYEYAIAVSHDCDHESKVGYANTEWVDSINSITSHSTTEMGVSPTVDKRDSGLTGKKVECPVHESIGPVRSLFPR